MHQWKGVGAGTAEDTNYETWEVKECKNCHRLVKEGYYCRTLTLKEAHLLQKEIEIQVEEDGTEIQAIDE